MQQILQFETGILPSPNQLCHLLSDKFFLIKFIYKNCPSRKHRYYSKIFVLSFESCFDSQKQTIEVTSANKPAPPACRMAWAYCAHSPATWSQTQHKNKSLTTRGYLSSCTSQLWEKANTNSSKWIIWNLLPPQIHFRCKTSYCCLCPVIETVLQRSRCNDSKSTTIQGQRSKGNSPRTLIHG